MSAKLLRDIHTFKDLLDYLEEKLDWPLQGYSLEDASFIYEPAELGLKEEDSATIKEIHQLRPLTSGQPWGIFFVEFEKKKLPVVVLRRILSHLVIKQRTPANKASAAAWHAEDLLFVTAFGEDEEESREIAFAHFHQAAGDMPTLHVLGWDGGDTPLKLAHVDRVLHERLHWPEDESDAEAWRMAWRSPFKHRIGHVIRTADQLAETLAKLARGIRDKARRMLDAESERGPLRKLHKAFQTGLIHDLTEENFADTYAQTITYGLLTAAISRTDMSEGRHGTALLADNVADIVPVTNPFLKEMLQTFLKVGGRKGGIDFDELGIQDVVELLRGDETDLPAILLDFGNKTRGEDPVIHFYEHFLSAYNKKLKVQRGVFYTPQPVVSYIVRSVHELLQTEFGLEDGLASTVTWGEMAARQIPPSPPFSKGGALSADTSVPPFGKGGLGGISTLTIPEGTSPDAHFVTILDPATGTGTFLVEVMEVINRTLMDKWKKQGMNETRQLAAWNDYVPKHLLPRLHGYELMMAPYAIAHMKIGLKLHETGYRFGSEERVRVYLTNALEPAHEVQPQLEALAPALAHEAMAVSEVKQRQRFTVVIGNPPYSVYSSNDIPVIQALMEDYKKINGALLNEVRIAPLMDDYCKFIRYSDNLISKSSCGVIGMITNHGFLTGPVFRGMRHSIRSRYSASILDLHGNYFRGDPSHGDTNVFEIKPGVCISILCRAINPSQPTLNYAEIRGPFEKKLEVLAGDRLIGGDAVMPQPPLFVWTPALYGNEEYALYPSVTEMFSIGTLGMMTGKDHFMIAWSKDEMSERIMCLNDQRIPDDVIRQNYDLEDSRDWVLKNARAAMFDPERVVPVNYRPFDIRWTFYHKDCHASPQRRVNEPMLMWKNIALCIPRQLAALPFEHCFVTNHVTEMSLISNKTKEANRVFPLFIGYDEGLFDKAAHTNLSPEFVQRLVAEFGGEKPSRQLTPEDIFHYAYAVFHSPNYRTRYAEFLKIDFPRLPLTGSLELFRALSHLGGELVALHLLESPKVNTFITRFEGKGDNSIPKKPFWKDGAVWINATQCFEGVPEAVWNFHVGGYQVCEKWLKDRKSRTLSIDDIAHYQRVVVALNETIRLMAEIDQVIEQHGGWPGAFQSGSSEAPP